MEIRTDVRLDELSDKVRCGIPISFVEALEVIEYQSTLRKEKKISIWTKIKERIARLL